MQMFGVVALSICAGLLLAVLFAGVAAVIYFALTIRAQTRVLCEQNQKFYAESREALEFQRQQITNVHEASKAAIVSLRQEIRQSLEAHGTTVKEAVSRINGEALALASRQIIVGVGRLERVAAAFQRLTLEAEAEPSDEGVIGQPWPAERAEEYAPEVPSGPSIYEKRRPDDVLRSEEQEGERLPIGL